jgi:predicted O-methyltransferase YrrM
VDASEVLNSIEETALAGDLPIIGPVKGEALDQILRELRPLRALEVGTLVGYSAIRIARQLPEKGKLTCVEVDPRMAAVARSNLRLAGLAGAVEVVVGDAKSVLKGLDGRMDFVLIDARKDEYLRYLRACEHLLRPGSVVVADNVGTFADQVAGYLRYVRESGRYSSSTIEAPLNSDPSIQDAMEVSVRL